MALNRTTNNFQTNDAMAYEEYYTENSLYHEYPDEGYVYNDEGQHYEEEYYESDQYRDTISDRDVGYFEALPNGLAPVVVVKPEEPRTFLEYFYPDDTNYPSSYGSFENRMQDLDSHSSGYDDTYYLNNKANSEPLLKNDSDSMFEFLIKKRGKMEKKNSIDYYRDVRSKTPHITSKNIQPSKNITNPPLQYSRNPVSYPRKEPLPSANVPLPPRPPVAPPPPIAQSNSNVQLQASSNTTKEVFRNKQGNQYYPSKFEKIRNFPLPPSTPKRIPIPDYDKQAVAEYIPAPDY